MNGNNKHKDFKMGLFTIGVVISLGTIVIASLQEAPSFVNATEGDYTMSFASNKNKCWTAVTTTESTATAKTALDNDVSFTYNNTGTALGYWGKINADGYFYNTTPIDGIKSIAITFKDTNGVKISYGWTANTYRVSDVSIAATEAGGTATYLFGNDQPSFFKIAYDTAIASIKSIALVYTCKSVQDPYNPGTEGLTMTLSGDGTYYIVSGYTGTSTDVKINDTYMHLPIKEIGAWAFENCSNISSVSLPKSITKIDANAFNGTVFTNVYYAGTEEEFSLVSKETRWLYGSSIQKTICSDSVDDYTFRFEKTSDGTAYKACGYTGTLSEITIPSKFDGLPVTQTYSGSYSSTVQTITIPSSVTTIGPGSFENCSSLQTVNIPSNVTLIGAYAFRYCTSLQKIDFPSSLSKIGMRAFEGCASLTSVDIPSSVTYIDNAAFNECTSLRHVYIPASVTTIYGPAFSYCPKIDDFTIAEDNPNYVFYGGVIYNKAKTFVNQGIYQFPTYEIPSTVGRIPSRSFEGLTSLTSLVIPSSVTRIATFAFLGCSSLASVNIPQAITSIEGWSFAGCSSLTNIDIPSSVNGIQNNAFQGCSSLESIKIPSSCTYVSSSSFEGCTALKTVLFSASLATISASAFKNCSSLTSISIPSTVTTIGADAFSGCSQLSIVCQTSSQPTGWDTAWNSDNRPVTWGSTYKSSLTTEDGIAASITWDDQGYVTGYSGASNTVDVSSILSTATVTTISSGFLSSNTTVTYLRLPDTVTTIAAGAVENCTALTTVIIGANVTSIGSTAFSGCTAIEACYYKGTPSQWSALNFTFFGDSVAYYSETDKSTETDHYYWHYDSDNKTPLLWNA